MGRGWIKLYRDMLDWGWYSDTSTKVVFIHLIITANHKDKEWQGITVKRGSLATSIRKLANELNLSPNTIKRALKNLEKTGEIKKKSTQRYTIITVNNYEKYQSVENR